MKLEDFNPLATDIITKCKPETVGEVTVLLDQLRTTLATENGEHETTVKKLADLEIANKGLIETNGKLFLKLGSQITDNQPGAGGQQQTPEKLSFDKLFDEKGGLK